MRDTADAVLYVGKAKNLRKRLGSYRVANPDRMPRRHLRMLRAVARIELIQCPDETSALAMESSLLRTLRPKFNRAGTWPAPPRFFAWRSVDQQLQLAVFETPDADWRLHGPLGSRAVSMRAVLARLLWIAVQSQSGLSALPVGWSHGRFEEKTSIHCGLMLEQVVYNLESLLSGQGAAFNEWILSRLPAGLHPFEQAWVDAELEFVANAFSGRTQRS